jgi:hypothetical protein
MKNIIKKKSGYIICLILLIFMYTPIGQASVSAQRTIEKNVLTAGSGTNVTVYLQNDNTSPLVLLKESIPSDWSLINISDDGSSFKAGEWIWPPTIGNNSDKIVKYGINVPSGTTPGTYTINGNVTAGVNTTIKVTGDLTIEVTSDSRGSSYNPTITPTPEKNDINVTVTPTETITATTAKQTIAAPIETAKEIPIATTNNKSPGFGIMVSIGIIATIYILRRIK